MADDGSRIEAANLGLVRPPVVYLGAIGIGLLLDVLVLAGVALFIWSVRTFSKAGTPVPGNQPTTIIVRAGPYSFSRNPIYVAFTLFQLGLAAWLNSAAVLAMAVPAWALMALVVIPREERYLEARFPTEYLPYRLAVRRWL